MSLACKCDVCGRIMSLDKVDKHVREVMLGTYGYEDNDYEVQHFFDVCDDCYGKILEQMKKSKKSDTISGTENTV